MSEHGKRTRGGLLPLAAAARAGDGFRKSMDTVIAQASAAPEAVLRLGAAPQASPEHEALEAAFLAAVDAHKSHRPNLRHDPDGIWRCPECDPLPARLARPKRRGTAPPLSAPGGVGSIPHNQG